jgi:hypothetical protein
VGLVFCPTHFFHQELKLQFGGQGDRGGIASLNTDLAAGEAAEGMGNERLSGFRVPLKDVLRTEIEALKIRAAEIGVNSRKPGKLLTKMVHQGHASILQASQE